MNEHRLICPRETADLLGISVYTLYRLGRHGDGPPSIHVSPRRRGYRLRDINAYVESRASHALNDSK